MTISAPRVLLALALTILPSTTARADDSCTSAQSIVFKQKAPCSGIIVPPHEAEVALKCLVEKLPQCQAKRFSEKTKFDARVKSWQITWEAERDRAHKLAKLLDEATKVAPPEVPWWKHPVLWTVLGVAVGAASTYAIIKLSEK